MSRTIFITGASSGIGKATALHFQRHGWNVIATMRNTDDGSELRPLDNVRVLRLDVTDEDTIKTAVAEGLAAFGKIDALLNNAGYGAYGPLEANALDGIRRQFDTNVIGLLAVTKEVLPHMRAQKSGVIVNMSSIGGKVALPLTSLYHGTKFAIEGISESLHYELAPCGIRIKIVEPGVVRTEFGKSVEFSNDGSMTEYQPVVEAVLASRKKMAASDAVTSAADVAAVVWTAATDDADTLRYPVGDFAVNIIARRKAEDDAEFYAGIKRQLGL